MRKQAKLLANLLGATKELTSEYVELAEITDAELNQIQHFMTERVSKNDRPRFARAMREAGCSMRQIADRLGWDHSTIVKDLSPKSGEKSPKSGEKSPLRPSQTGGREEQREQVAEAAAAEGVTEEPDEVISYRILYADPPWDYGAHLQPDYQTEQRDHYAVMTVKEICALQIWGYPVKDWVEDDAVLFLWVTVPMLERSFEVVRAWGFQYKTCFVWDKIKHNMGHYNSVRHELLLICTRGACQPDKQQLFDSVQSIERGNHSQKPVEFYDIIETIYTHGRKLEIFARSKREGWDTYGHVAQIQEAAE